jgi:PilZ domain
MVSLTVPARQYQTEQHGTSFSPQTRPGQPLFEALVCETHHAAAMTAVLTSYIDGAIAQRTALNPFELKRILPVEPANLLSLSRRQLLDIEPLPETLAVLDDFFLSLRMLNDDLRLYGSDYQRMGAARAIVVSGQILSRSARGACHDALRVVRQLEIETAGRLSDRYCDHAKALSQLLVAAEAGTAPCLDATGQIFLPELPQRRRSLRRGVSQACRVDLRHVSHPAFAKDISDGGIGLQRAGFLTLDDAVAIQLASGRQFTGRVVWSSGDTAGVRFHRRLDPHDPLLLV